MKEYTISFTGHRPKGLPWGYNENLPQAIKFKQDMKTLLIEKINQGYHNFIVGMALGIDMMVAELLIELKNEYNIFIKAAIPCKNQEIKWNMLQQKRYKNILEKCDNIVFVSDNYSINCMQRRNEYMVDNSNMLIAVWNGKPSGTENTIKYANQKGVDIIIIEISCTIE